jgi:hypothetical protein
MKNRIHSRIIIGSTESERKGLRVISVTQSINKTKDFIIGTNDRFKVANIIS